MYEASTVTETGAVITARHKNRAMALAELAAMLLPSINNIEVTQSNEHVLIFIDDNLKLSMTIKKITS